MLTQYGMSEKFGLMGLATQENQYLSGRTVLNCGDDTATEVDHEVMVLLHNSYEEAKRLIGGHREALDKIADYLIRRETITGKEFMKIFRAVDGAGLARIDFFLTKEGPVFNELNTLPGFTAISMYPMLWEVKGLDKDTLMEKLIQTAFLRESRGKY